MISWPEIEKFCSSGHYYFIYISGEQGVTD
ncbi:MAG: YcxB family protein [Synergistaceae bacterium]|nr:YcxB family protein [Synergistaceae bacterium]